MDNRKSVKSNNKRKGDSEMTVIVHCSNDPEKQKEIDQRIAKSHAEFVANYIEKLNCPKEQKLELIDAIVQRMNENCKQQKNKEII